MARKSKQVASREGSPGDYSPSDPESSEAEKVSRKQEIEEVVTRLPPLNSDVLPLPWKGRLGYACLNTVLRALREPVFCSRTCRIDTIKKEEYGMKYVLELGRKNAADLSGLIEWNQKFGIKFLRVSSEMFPFASHAEYGYNLEHADKELKAAGALAMKYGHRLTTHPGQFTQLASPKEKVVEASFRDLEYHSELLTRLGLKDQSDRDAIMIIHMGGMFGDKEATLARFHENYVKLSDRVKQRLVLENDDVSWTVQDLLPTCQKLNIPLVLDWHHHNIMPGSMREGTSEILDYVTAITETWKRKSITPKQHYSEPRDTAVTNHERRKHSARVKNLPPCTNDMDLMIEAKDKEQAVFELAKLWDLKNPRVPDPIQPISDPVDRGAFEGYWPEGDEKRLKPPPLRRQKKVEIDEDGEGIKASKPRKRKVKVEQQKDENGEELMVEVVVKPNRRKAKAEKEGDEKGEEVKASKPSRKKTKVEKQGDEIVVEDGIRDELINTETVNLKPIKPKKRKSGKGDSIEAVGKGKARRTVTDPTSETHEHHNEIVNTSERKRVVKRPQDAKEGTPSGASAVEKMKSRVSAKQAARSPEEATPAVVAKARRVSTTKSRKPSPNIAETTLTRQSLRKKVKA